MPQQLIARELQEEPPAPAMAMAGALAAHGGSNVAAILFYGSNLRSGSVEGVLDFYVLVDRLVEWHQSRPLALATRILPPTVEYWELPWQGHILRAKVAIIRTDQFIRAMRPGGLDTTLWARFAQPVMLPHARDAMARQMVTDTLAAAVTTAARWAALLGPETASAPAYWETLFRATYGAELRVEKGERGASLVSHAEARYRALLLPAWKAAGIAGGPSDGDLLRPILTGQQRAAGRFGWGLRRRLGKMLNLARLSKAAFTFKDGVDYILWKIERHSGVRVELTPWQRRHPILSAPFILSRLRRQGAVR